MPIIVNSTQCIIKQIPINHYSSHKQTQQNTQKKKKNPIAVPTSQTPQKFNTFHVSSPWPPSSQSIYNNNKKKLKGLHNFIFYFFIYNKTIVVFIENL